MVGPLRDWLAGTWVLASGPVKWSVLASPGWALALVALLLTRLEPVQVDHRAVWKRTWTASLGLFCFVLLARLMVTSGMIQAIAGVIQEQGAGRGAALGVLAPLLGAVSGFTAGSNGAATPSSW